MSAILLLSRPGRCAGRVPLSRLIQKLARFRLPHQLLPYCQCIRVGKKSSCSMVSLRKVKSPAPEGRRSIVPQNRENENRLLGNGEKKAGHICVPLFVTDSGR